LSVVGKERDRRRACHPDGGLFGQDRKSDRRGHRRLGGFTREAARPIWWSRSRSSVSVPRTTWSKRLEKVSTNRVMGSSPPHLELSPRRVFHRPAAPPGSRRLVSTSRPLPGVDDLREIREVDRRVAGPACSGRTSWRIVSRRIGLSARKIRRRLSSGVSGGQLLPGQPLVGLEVEKSQAPVGADVGRTVEHARQRRLQPGGAIGVAGTVDQDGPESTPASSSTILSAGSSDTMRGQISSGPVAGRPGSACPGAMVDRPRLQKIGTRVLRHRRFDARRLA
jgi:hypothetical protein